MLMQSSPLETERNREFEILPPEPFCDTNLIKATEKHYKASEITEGISTHMPSEDAGHVTSASEPAGRSLVDCLRLAASEVEIKTEFVKNKPEAEISKRTVRKMKISKEESSSVGDQTFTNEQKPDACESSEPDRKKSRKPSVQEMNTSPEDNNNAVGLCSTEDSLEKEVDFYDIANEEHLKNDDEEPGVVKPALQQKETSVSRLVLSDAVEGELEFEQGQEDVGTVWLAELYMKEG